MEYTWIKIIYEEWMAAINERFNNPKVSSKDKRSDFEKGCASHIRMLYNVKCKNKEEVKANDAMRDVLFFSENPYLIIEYIESSPEKRRDIIMQFRR